MGVGTATAAESSPAVALEGVTQVPCALMPDHHHWLHVDYSNSAEFAVESHLLHSNRHSIKLCTNISGFSVCHFYTNYSLPSLSLSLGSGGRGWVDPRSMKSHFIQSYDICI
jgi:hypothetical protein